ncbi:uncharacterized protein Sec16 isoform X2 [Chelonus insularis]|uniref:uncharacterized protein Sec16 isoform X2 n=1 Tax=Chelonus insularis TaxID=460826 RepID=UPI00158E6059|nr:uncharacterized protein LOC118070863 isoform X2 [Chelonus insularis]
MNNPYRARSGKLRADHTASVGVSKYGLQNQNSWPAMPPNMQPINPYPSQSAVNQTNNAGDPWDWGSENIDNGNDAWNWSIDQSAETQSQLLQQQPQQQQLISTYPNLRPNQQNSTHDNFYTNINGNNQTIPLTPNQLSGRNTPRTGPSKESTPSQPDSFNQYSNYNLNQQPPRTDSVKSCSITNENQNLQHINCYFPPVSSPFDLTNQTVSTQKFSLNNNNSNSANQSNIPAQNWQIPTPNTSTYWTDPNSKKENVSMIDTQWAQVQHQPSQFYKQQQLNHQSPPQLTELLQHQLLNQHPQQQQSSVKQPSHQQQLKRISPPPQLHQLHIKSSQISNVPQNCHGNLETNQLKEPSQEIVLSNKRYEGNHGNEIVDQRSQQNNYSQLENSNISSNQLRQHASLYPTHTWQEKNSELNNKLKDVSLDSFSEENKHLQKDWQSIGSSSINLASSTGEIVTADKKLEDSLLEEQISVFSESENHSDKSTLIPEIKSNLMELQRSENRSSDIELFNVKENTNSSWNAEKDTNSLSDLTTGVNQLNLARKPHNLFDDLKSSFPPQSSSQIIDPWPSQSTISHPIIHKPQEKLTVSNQCVAQSTINSQEHITTTPFSAAQESKINLSQEHTSLTQIGVQPHLRQQEYSNIYNCPLVPSSLHSHEFSTHISSSIVHPNVQQSHSSHFESIETVSLQPNPKTSAENFHASLESKSNEESMSSSNSIEISNSQATEVISSTSYDTWYNKTTTHTADFINVDTSSSNSHDQIPVTESSIEDTKVPTPSKEIYEPLQQSLQSDIHSENYEFASNDRNTFLETGELTDSHHDQESIIFQDDENDEVPSDIPFIREVPGQSSSIDPRRNPTGQEEYLQLQSNSRLVDPRRNDLSTQIQGFNIRKLPLERSERRDVPSGQERQGSGLSPQDTESLERRNDPSGREQSLPPSQSRNDPSGEERAINDSQIILEPTEIREIPGSRVDSTELTSTVDEIRQITGGISTLEPLTVSDNNARVVPGSQETLVSAKQDISNETRNKREEAVGAPIREDVTLVSSSPKRRDSYEDGDDEESGNSRDDNRDRRRDQSPTDRRRFDYDRKGDRNYYDRDRKYDDDYYYERRRGHDYDRSYTSREDLDRRETSFRDGDRRLPNRDDLDDRRRIKDDDERDGRRREDRRGHWNDSRSREHRDYDARFSRDVRDREHLDRDRRRDGRRRWYDEYDPRDLRRDYFDDPYTKGSRPSSRSSYNDRDRDYYMRVRDPYYGYNPDVYGSYDYGANYYAYLENLRRTNPTAYMEWYNKYYAAQQQHPVVRGVSTYPEDRASVHSGRSSCEDRTTSGKQTIGDISLLEDAKAVSRLTPTKFSTSHVQGSFSIGSLVHVHPSYPAEGERARVDIVRLDSLLMHDPIARELRAYPGPLIKGVTHKKTIIEYCEAKIKKASTNDDLIDRASYILLYQLMIMLIQQNGNVVGVDIATLLLQNKEAYPHEVNGNKNESMRRESTISQRSGGKEGSVHEDAPQEIENTKQQKTIEQMTNEFRNTLIYGLVQEALEYAMNEGLWGHALFLASKLDKRTHASVMTRFANSLPAQDPLQTLYQLHSGRVPASVTCVSDPKWDDWRPHLAMIISNTSANPEINRRAITTLGDTLVARGDIYAAHFCYILAQIEFGTYGSSGVKLVLIGANHHKLYRDFATFEAIMLTEIYEYARNLSESEFTLVGLQIFKLETAQRMVDYGLIEKALLYLEQIAVNIVKEPPKYKQSFVNDVYTLSERIKFHDPVFKDCIEDETTLAWLYNLKEIVHRCQAGDIIQNVNNTCVNSQNNLPDTSQREIQPPSQIQQQQQPQQQQWNYTATQDYGNAPSSMMEIPTIDPSQDQWQPMSLQTTIQDTYSNDQNTQYTQNINVNQYHQQQPQDYWGQQVYNQQDYAKDYSTSDWQQQQSNQVYPQEQNDVDSAQQSGGWNYEPKPQISMGSSTGKQYDPLEELDALESPSEVSKSTIETKKPQDKQPEKKASNSGGSWFGGLFSKLTPKPRNQMILPDDDNPTIIWDPIAKKWVNKDDDGDSASLRLAPPPKMSELNLKTSITTEQNLSTQESTVRPPSTDSKTPNSSKMIAGSSNMFKLQKGRNMRANYIDVMNPGGVKSNGPPSAIPTPAASPLMQPMAASSPQLFVPAPVNDPNAPVDFLTTLQTTRPSGDTTTSQGLSRWSSASSLSREVQSYTMRDPRLHQRIKGPMMYNPAEVKENPMKNVTKSRYPPR